MKPLCNSVYDASILVKISITVEYGGTA
jgi:hypothetical protein